MGNKTILYFASFIKNSKELNHQEKEILLRRLKDKTLEKIGKRYKLSGERIRQIEEKALRKFIAKICQLFLID